MRDNDRNFCNTTLHPIAKEFQLEKFSLRHEPVDDFLKSQVSFKYFRNIKLILKFLLSLSLALSSLQWQNSQKSYLWLIYRWGLAVCFCIGVIGSLVQQFAQGLWFIYLTDWGFFLCMFVSLYGAILVTIYQF